MKRAPTQITVVKTVSTPKEVIDLRLADKGWTYSKLISMTGIARSTFYQHMKDGAWTLLELQLMNIHLHFEAEDLYVFIGGKVA